MDEAERKSACCAHFCVFFSAQGVDRGSYYGANQDLSAYGKTTDFTFSSDIPGKEIETWFAGRRQGMDNNDGKGYFQLAVDDEFIDFYDINFFNWSFRFSFNQKKYFNNNTRQLRHRQPYAVHRQPFLL